MQNLASWLKQNKTMPIAAMKKKKKTKHTQTKKKFVKTNTRK